MACYDPILGLPDYDKGLSVDGNFRYKLFGNWTPEASRHWPSSIKIPCGKCLGCRLDYSRRWADRMILELDSAGSAIFLTLTYNNDFVPVRFGEDDNFLGFSLDKSDLQRFNKRLRNHFSDKNIRFYASGEYGGRTFRPHYHAIYFGLCLSDFSDITEIGMNELGQVYYTSKELEKIWHNGFILLSDVSYKTCAYVSRYTMKKVNSFDTFSWQEPEFSLMSRRPGIGYPYLESHPDCVDFNHIFLSSSDGQHTISVPRYFLDKLKLTDYDRYCKIVSERRRVGYDREFLKLKRTSLSYLDSLELEYNTLLNKTKILFNRREEVLP